LIEIDESMLVRLAGARAFGQGLQCYEKGGVRDVVTTGTATSALVQGTYTVRLRHTHRIMEGECGCEVSDGIDFCQHCVAVALHLQDQQKPSRPIDKRGALRRIRRHLSALSQEELLDRFLETIEQDRALRDDLLQEARLASGALQYADLHKMIDAVATDDYLYELREIRDFFKGLESMLLRLGEFADKLDPLVLLRSVEHAVRRLNVDIGMIDWVEDFPECSMDLLVDLHRKAIGRLNWTPEETASYLVDRGTAESWHPFSALAVLYCEDLGAAFQEAAVAEIESRRNAFETADTAGIDQAQRRELLEELAENVEAATA
jgi:hypothetical protein